MISDSHIEEQEQDIIQDMNDKKTKDINKQPDFNRGSNISDKKNYTPEQARNEKMQIYTQESLMVLIYILQIKTSIPALLIPGQKFKNLDIIHNKFYDSLKCKQNDQMVYYLQNQFPYLLKNEEWNQEYYKTEQKQTLEIFEKNQQNIDHEVFIDQQMQNFYDDNDSLQDGEGEEEEQKVQQNKQANKYQYEYKNNSKIEEELEDGEEEQLQQINKQEKIQQKIKNNIKNQQSEQLKDIEDEDVQIFQENSEENSDNQQQEFDEDEEIRIQEENLEEEEKNLEINDFQNQAEGLLLSEQPIGFKQPLMDYQLQAITWMQYREGALSFEAAKKYNTQQNFQLRQLSLFWKEIILIDGTILYYNPFSGQISNKFVKNLEKQCKGGILADEMGLGKTLMTLGLILNCPSQFDHKSQKLRFFDEDEYSQSQEECISRQNSLQSLEPVLKKQLKNNEGQGIVQQKKYNNFQQEQNKETDEANQQPEDEFMAEFVRGKQNLFKRFKGLVRAGTLIVVPKSLLKQWQKEIKSKITEGNLTFLEYYEQKIRGTYDLNLFDIVITTYTVLGIEFEKLKKAQKQSLFKYQWHRVILDEGHIIKSKENKWSKSAFNLQSDNRWVLTGTPLQNKIDDVFSLIFFLKLEFFQNYSWWKRYITQNQNMDEVFKLVQNILNPILLRRTKETVYKNGKKILELPKKNIEVIRVTLDKQEQDIYDGIYSFSRNIFKNMMNGGKLRRKMMHVFSIIQHLRQICDHQVLIFRNPKGLLKYYNNIEERKKQEFDDNVKKVLRQLEIQYQNQEELLMSSDGSQISFQQQRVADILKNEDEECCICLDKIKLDMKPRLLKCGHLYHKNCLNDLIGQEGNQKCAQCRQETLLQYTILSQKLLQSKIELQVRKIKHRTEWFQTIDNSMSSKMKACIEEIIKIKKRGEKCILYTQWIRVMNLFEKFLNQKGLRFCRIDGTMTTQERERQIQDFTDNEDKNVFIISLQAGALGLNLVAANHVLIFDPWWNPAVENQAADRCYRIGQQKEVYVKNFICSGTIEERILELQNQKKKLIDNTINKNAAYFNYQQNKEEDMKYLFDLDQNID